MIRVYPRKKLDYSFGNILSALTMTIVPRLDKRKIINEIENLWPMENVIVGLSVRTIFDSLLLTKNFKKGSEVIMTGITIPDMVKIVESNGLKIVPIDLDMETLQLKKEALNKAVSKKTVMIVVAHLFGSRMEMDPVYKALDKRSDVLIVEDCAQAYNGISGYIKQSKTDISMFSFGSIKSITALGGAIGFTMDKELKKEINNKISKYPKIKNAEFRKKVLKYIALKILSNPFIYGFFILACRFLKIDYDKAIISSVRMVQDDNLFEAIRKNPSTSHLRYLLYRLTSMQENHISQRKEVGDYLKNLLKNCDIHGSANPTHSYWLFPIRSSKREKLVKLLRDSGFDATFTSTQLIPINEPDEVDNTLVECEKYMSETIYLPVYETMSKKSLDKLARVVNDNS
ncbi:MAG: DegT/DnrJ/EryC1/StrS family aminotransferase [Candidatus Neomarinimicrobiota bacterium]